MHQSPPGRKFRQARIIGVNLAVIAVVLAAAAMTPRDGQALVLVAPWSEPGRVLEVIAEAGGSIMNGTGTPYAAIAYSSEPYFTYRLFSSGAVLVLDGSLAFLCRSTPQ
ncbi:MAG: hypothetical protein KUA43_08940 [Hoeflea sp.]|uniref:hypothetical protein n=1 Tax=Hoeflea sp. TaxID=1940281 RepID=UPI001D837C71|nr:hypothetical protein [Hoeflea sp.]MBU4529790.1 hypothetical protein [Alphaproteobacteria bacterium]MBU4543351.1 hypothetical protein [Alphaproteobacteria bacterium]MBU4552538.1 hypothetical protein [Alphaproteobacteria bacterium]MBV1723554.1 hypothetical protein [Hoeflea sp.]MBV1763003.1 hypothetical protein [Hoeflea sp.]